MVVTVVALGALAVVFWPHEVGGGAGRGGVSDPRGTASGGDAERGDSNQGGFLLDGQGRAVTLGGRLAPVTLLHFWATWTLNSCRSSMKRRKCCALSFAPKTS